MKEKILYIEDMEKCHELTRQTLGELYEVISVYTPKQADAEIRSNIMAYSGLISDVNLVYDESKPVNKQSTEGLELIALSREESKRRGINKLPIFCISSDGSHKKPSLKAGANIFMWKKDFWNRKGGEYLKKILKHKSKNGRHKGQIR